MDEDDLDQLYARLERRLCNVIFRWVWRMEEAQDIAQEAFVRLWRMRDRVDMASVEPLVYRIALNLAVSRRRSQKLWRWLSLETLAERPSPRQAADESIAARDERRRLRAAVDALPEDLRRVIVLCELSELGYDAVGRILSIPAGTVGSRRHRALRLLRETLSRDRLPEKDPE